ncbi:MAG: tyrosine-type recombinase/integrase [Prevotella histicola]|nr:tyrosine-type recombinase/integrase [Prevotella histicola]
MGKTAADLIESAFYYLYPKDTDTRKTYISRLNSYLEYLKYKNLDSLEVFKQSGLNAYTRYLTEKGESKAMINAKCEMIVRLVNKVLAVEEPYLKFNISGGLQYNKKKDSRPDKGKFALTLDEVQAIEKLEFAPAEKYDLKTILPRQEDGSINPKYPLSLRGRLLSEYRDIFVLQCRTGQRVSDLAQYLLYIVGQTTDKVKQVEVEGQCYYELKTKKSQGKECALIVEDEYIRTFIGKYSRVKFLIDVAKLDNNNSYYNYAIKMLAKLAGIDRGITYRNAHDKEVTEPAYFKISSHDARHTFITQKLNEGVSPDKLCYLTGHTDDNMIKTIYSHLTSTDKAKMITKELGKIRGKVVENPPTTIEDGDIEFRRKYPEFKEDVILRIDKVEQVGGIQIQNALKYFHAKQGSLGSIRMWLKKNNIELNEIIKALIQAEVKCVGEDKAELEKWEKYLFELQGNLLRMNELENIGYIER